MGDEADEDDDVDEEDREFIRETEEFFDQSWKEFKVDIKELSKKDLARQMFVSGALLYKKQIDRKLESSLEQMKEHPEEITKMLADLKSGEVHSGDEEELWHEGAFVQAMDSKEKEEKKRTFHMKHDEEMKYNCKQCNATISAHNKDWHDYLCDNCFNQKHFPEK